MRRPNKPHIAGYEDEEDCEGYYDPDEAERRDCIKHIGYESYRGDNNPCRVCFNRWKSADDAKRKAEWDAKTPEEKAQHEAFIKGLRSLY